MGTSLRSWSPKFVVALIVVALGSGVATVVAAGSSASFGSRAGLGDPVAFLKRVVREIAANQYGSAWESLDPVQQALVPMTEYVRCESLSPIPGRLTSIQVIALRDQLIRVAGSDAKLVQSIGRYAQTHDHRVPPG
jgi:hypothetical protein